MRSIQPPERNWRRSVAVAAAPLDKPFTSGTLRTLKMNFTFSFSLLEGEDRDGEVEPGGGTAAAGLAGAERAGAHRRGPQRGRAGEGRQDPALRGVRRAQGKA